MRMGESGQPELDPYSHRVIATLEEQGIPYSVVPVCLDPKPAWLYSITRNATYCRQYTSPQFPHVVQHLCASQAKSYACMA